MNDGGPAFPRTGNFDANQEGVYDSTAQDGMTLRDYFAAAAVSALLPEYTSDDWAEHVARESYILADAMLLERAKT
jgi:hypothetical protein